MRQPQPDGEVPSAPVRRGGSARRGARHASHAQTIPHAHVPRRREATQSTKRTRGDASKHAASRPHVALPPARPARHARLCLAASPAVTMPAASHARGTPREPLRGDLGRQEARNGIHRRQSHVMAPQGGSQRVTRHAGASPACRCDAGGYAEARRRGHRADVCPGAALAWLRAALAGCRHDSRVVHPMPSVRNVCVVCVSRARCQTRARDGRMW